MKQRALVWLLASGSVALACGADDAPSGPGDRDAGGDAAAVATSSSGTPGASSGSSSGGSSSSGAPNDAAIGTPNDAYGIAVLADGPVAYWRFEETTGTVAQDEIGNAHPGTYWGGFTLGEPGITGESRAAKLDGTTGCIAVGEYFRFPGRIPYSAESWVKISEYGAEGTRIVSTEGFPTGIRSGWNLSASYGDTGYPYFDSWSSEGPDNQYVMGAYSSVSADQGKLPLNEWAYVVGTFDDTEESIWVNGVLRNRVRQSTLPHPNEGTFTIGCAGNGSGAIYLGLHGAVDEVALYDEVLTDAQIAAHWAAGKP